MDGFTVYLAPCSRLYQLNLLNSYYSRVSRILGNGNGKREREAGTGKVEICFKRSIPHLFTIHIELNS